MSRYYNNYHENVKNAKSPSMAYRKAKADSEITKFDKKKAKEGGYTQDYHGVVRMHQDRKRKRKK